VIRTLSSHHALDQEFTSGSLKVIQKRRVEILPESTMIKVKQSKHPGLPDTAMELASYRGMKSIQVGLNPNPVMSIKGLRRQALTG
jgi:hypothetical protein